MTVTTIVRFIICCQ